MMRLFLNGLAASAGGGLTYLRNVVPELSRQAGVQTIIAAGPQLRRELGELANITLLEVELPSGAFRRAWQEQAMLPGVIRRSGADVLISAGNFALRRSPVPQILLSRNALYTSADFYRDLRARGEYRMWMDTYLKGFLAKSSVKWADCTVAPSHAFAEELGRWTGREIRVIPHGFDPEAFFCDKTPLPAEIGHKFDIAAGSLRLLFVSHYNYYRNFEALLRALPILQQRMSGREVKLFLTCTLEPGANPGAYRTEAAAALVRDLGMTDRVVQLGAIPYPLLHQVYGACDLYVTPAYAETFAHPLVEAMASGLPVIASDLAVHREICGDAALYFAAFSSAELARRIIEAEHEEVRKRKSAAGRKRAAEFSWKRSVEALVGLARELADRCRQPGGANP